MFQDGDVERCLFINRAADSPNRQQRPILNCGERVGTTGGDEMGGGGGGGGYSCCCFICHSSAPTLPPHTPSHGRCQGQQQPATKCRVIQHVGGVARKRSTTTRRPQRRRGGPQECRWRSKVCLFGRGDNMSGVSQLTITDRCFPLGYPPHHPKPQPSFFSPSLFLFSGPLPPPLCLVCCQCSLARTDCKNRLLPKISILE